MIHLTSERLKDIKDNAKYETSRHGLAMIYDLLAEVTVLRADRAELQARIEKLRAALKTLQAGTELVLKENPEPFFAPGTIACIMALADDSQGTQEKEV